MGRAPSNARKFLQKIGKQVGRIGKGGAGAIGLIAALITVASAVNFSSHSSATRTNIPLSIGSLASNPVKAAVGRDSVWVWDAGGSVFRIDPNTQRVKATLENVSGFPGQLAAVGDRVWVLGSQSGVVSLNPPVFVRRIDAKNAITAPTQVLSPSLNALPPCGLAAGADSVWICDPSSGVVRLNAETNRVITTISIYDQPAGVTFGGGQLFVRGSSGTLWRVDPTTNAATLIASGLFGPFAYQDGALWVGSGDGVKRVDPRSGVVTGDVATNFPQAVVAGQGSIWTLDPVHSTLVRIDPRAASISNTTSLGAPVPDDIAVGDGAVWLPSALRHGIIRIGT